MGRYSLRVMVQPSAMSMKLAFPALSPPATPKFTMTDPSSFFSAKALLML